MARGLAGLVKVSICAAGLLAPLPCLAQSGEDESPVHWAYGAFFGTGRYQIGDGAEVTVLRAEVRRSIRPTSLEDDGNRVGITLRFPVAVGSQDLSFASASELADSSVSTASFVPGIELPIALGEAWTIKPLASVGYGYAFDTEESAWIYQLGIRSQYAFASTRFDWFLTNALLIYGYHSDTALAQRSVPLSMGIEARIQLRNRKLGEDPVFLHWHVGQTHYLDEFTFLQGEGEPVLELDNEWEIGAAFSKGDKRLRLTKFSWDRVGLAFRFDGSGDLTGVRLSFRSLFDR